MKLAFTVFLVVLMVVGLAVGLARGFTSRGTVDLVGHTSKTVTLESPRAPAEALRRIRERFQLGRYSIDDVDEQRQRIVLSSKPTIATWGFFYPVRILGEASGGSTILVGRFAIGCLLAGFDFRRG